MVRRPAVAGSFYPGSKVSLEKELSQYITPAEEKKKVIGLISPHAGYVYSAGCAGKGFGKGVPHTPVIDTHYNDTVGDFNTAEPFPGTAGRVDIPGMG